MEQRNDKSASELKAENAKLREELRLADATVQALRLQRISNIEAWEPTLRDIHDRANSEIVRRHAALALDALTGTTSQQPSAPTPDVEKIAREAGEILVNYIAHTPTSSLNDEKIGLELTPTFNRVIAKALAQARAPFATANLLLVKAIREALETDDWTILRTALAGTEQK